VKIISYQEAWERIESGKIVVATYESDCGCEIESLLDIDSLKAYADDNEVFFGFDVEAEKDAERIFDSLKEETKEYLYRLLLTDNNPLFNT
jgi:hypothetical protein